MRPVQFTPAQIDYLASLCARAAYATTGDGTITRAFDQLSEEGREVVADAVKRRFVRLVKELGVDHV